MARVEHMIIYHDSTRNPIYRYGVQCDNGWYNLINELVAKLYEIDTLKEIQIFQIKEKFGRFRFYYNSNTVTNENINDVVNDYIKKIDSACESCGQPGTLINNEERCKTLCEVCAKE